MGLPPEVPPTIRTLLLLGSKKARWSLRGMDRAFSVADTVPAAVSYTSADDRSAEPLLPPAIRTLPLSNAVAESPARATERLAPGDEERVSGTWITGGARAFRPAG